MGEVIFLKGAAAAREDRSTAAPMRQPGIRLQHPASHFVRLGTMARKVVARIEQHMHEEAATACHRCE